MSNNIVTEERIVTVVELAVPKVVVTGNKSATVTAQSGRPDAAIQVSGNGEIRLATVGMLGPIGPQGNIGLQGVQGIQGIPGPAGTTYVHLQSIASSVWTVHHNLNKYPAVSVVDSANERVEGDIDYIDLNTVVISFSAPFGGSAYLT